MPRAENRNNNTTTTGLLRIIYQIAAETGDPSMKAPKLSMPFTEEEPEVVTMPVARDALADRCVGCGVRQSYRRMPSGLTSRPQKVLLPFLAISACF